MPVPAAGPLRLVAVGNLKALKNYDRLLSAMASLVADPVHLDIYGSGSLKEGLQQRIKDEKLNVRLCGQVNDMAQILTNYHMLIMPSLHEGFGLAPAEAMAVGLPVLLSELDVFKELFKSYPVYFDPVSPQSIATAIKYALKHKEALQERAIAAKAYATVRFSADRYCQQLDSIYQSVFARHIIKS
jgi:glycosyltransferase involved in cell wall biosynthesis